MSLWSKFRTIAREEANQAFRSLTLNKSQQQNTPVLAKVVAVEGTSYTVLLPSGETKVAYAVGSRSIGLGQACHIVGDSIF